MRAAGTSWSKIGALYGLTKQGAQQRFQRDARAGTARSAPPDGTGEQPAEP